MRRAEGAAQGLAPTYDLIDTDRMPVVPPVSTLLATADAKRFASLNLTYPINNQVVVHPDTRSGSARKADAANSAVFRDTIRSVGGSMIHVIDAADRQQDVWSVAFRPTPGGIGQQADLLQVDHVTETMNHDEMQGWSLFHTSLFDMARAPMVDVIGPDRPVHGLAIRGCNGTVRVPLNGSETLLTLADSFLAPRSGGAVQHVARATDDTVATARAMAALWFAAPGRVCADRSHPRAERHPT